MNTLPNLLKYTTSHEWVYDEGQGIYRVGITEHAQALLGDMVFIDLPILNKHYDAEQECAIAESVKAASDIYVPMSGEIVEVNGRLNDEPELINHSPYDEGWIFLIKASDPAQLATLLDAETYQKLIAE